MTRQEAQQRMLAHNKMIDDFTNNELAKKLNAKDGKVSIGKWFVAQELISEQKFYEKGMAVLEELRSEGFDVKMNMQSNKLVGIGIYC